MKTITIRMVGDNLYTSKILRAGKVGDGYDFKSQYDEVAPLIKQADIAIVDQETILVSDRKKIGDFPVFGTPKEAADALVNAGFNVIMQGTNHALDQGYDGIVEDIRIWEKYKDKVSLIGIHDSKESAEKICVVEKNGIKIAILNYTESLNYHRRPMGKAYCVDTMKKSDKAKIAADIKKAKEMSDFVLVLPHWGVEYLYEPVDRQKKWAKYFAEAGADLIIGTHPHVLQYIENLTTSDGRSVPCFYSLGNFISSHMNIQGVVIGGMADVELVQNEQGKVEIRKYDIIPTITHTDSGFNYFKVEKLDDYTNEMAKESKLIQIINAKFGDSLDADKLRGIYKDILERKALEKSIFKKPSDVWIFDITRFFKAKRRKRKK